MTTTYNPSAFPTQQIIYPPSAASQVIGLPIAGARVFTWSSLNHATPKTTYQTNSGSPPPALPNPVVANGIGQVEIYWALNDADITDLYFVQIKGPTGDDTVYYSYDNFDGAAYIGNDSPSTRNDVNFVRNPQFTWNRFKKTYNLNAASAAVYTGVFVADDWYFTKNNTNATETIVIEDFALGQDVVPDNPIHYLNWTLTSGASGETYKNIFQKFASVQTLAGKTVTLQFWASSNVSTPFTVKFRQFFGTGGSPSTDVVTAFPNPFTLTSGFALYTGTVTIPDIDSKVLGTSLTDCLQLEFNLPLNAGGSTTFNLANVQLEPGSVANAFQYETPNDQQTRLSKDWFGPPTGDIKFAAGALGNYPGWLRMNDGTIGNIASLATTFASENAYALYDYLWTNFANPQCPVSTGRGANSLADFNANKTLNLPLTMCRLMGNEGTGAGLTARVNGVTGGSETEVAAHTHDTAGWMLTGTAGTDAAGDPAAGVAYDMLVVTQGTGGTSQTTLNTGTNITTNNMNPFSFITMYIKL